MMNRKLAGLGFAVALMITGEPARADTEEMSTVNAHRIFGRGWPQVPDRAGPSRRPIRAIPRRLDFSRIPVVIEEGGRYWIDRNWDLGVIETSALALQILASDVTIDMRGFRISVEDYLGGPVVTIAGDNVTLRNGEILAGGEFNFTLSATGAATTLQEMRIIGDDSSASLASGAVISSSAFGGAVSVGPNSSVLGSEFYCMSGQGCLALYGEVGLSLGSNVRVYGNVFGSEQGGYAVSIDGDDNYLERNTIYSSTSSSGVRVAGDRNILRDNTLISDGSAGAAFRIDGAENILKGNIAKPSQFAKWHRGIVFLQDGNYYGDNQMGAAVPFDLGGTVQTDWGQNFGF